MGRMSLGCCSSSGPAPSASGASPGTRLWDPRVPTQLSPSSLNGNCSTSSTNRSPPGRRPRGDTGCVERSLLATTRAALHVDVWRLSHDGGDIDSRTTPPRVRAHRLGASTYIYAICLLTICAHHV